MFGYAPNWLQSHYGKEPINLFIRRSFDGGRTWTTTPATTDEGLVGMTRTSPWIRPTRMTTASSMRCSRTSTAASASTVCPTAASTPTQSRSSTLRSRAPAPKSWAGSSSTSRTTRRVTSSAAATCRSSTTAPRPSSTRATAPTNNRRQTAILRKLSLDQTEEDATTTGAYNLLNGRFNFEPLTVTPDETLYSGFTAETGLVSPLADEVRASARTDDVRDPSKFFAVYESGDSGPMREGFEAAAENLYYSRATQWGDIWEDVLWVPSGNSQNVDANTEPSMYWDWLENDAEDKSGEAAVGSSPGWPVLLRHVEPVDRSTKVTSTSTSSTRCSVAATGCPTSSARSSSRWRTKRSSSLPKSPLRPKAKSSL